MQRTLSRRLLLQDTVLMSAEVLMSGVTPAMATTRVEVQPEAAQGSAMPSPVAAPNVQAGASTETYPEAPGALTLRVNGAERTLHAEPRMTLAPRCRTGLARQSRR